MHVFTGGVVQRTLGNKSTLAKGLHTLNNSEMLRMDGEQRETMGGSLKRRLKKSDINFRNVFLV